MLLTFLKAGLCCASKLFFLSEDVGTHLFPFRLINAVRPGAIKKYNTRAIPLLEMVTHNIARLKTNQVVCRKISVFILKPAGRYTLFLTGSF